MSESDFADKVSNLLFMVVSLMITILLFQSMADFFISLTVLESHLLLDKVLYIIILIELLHLSLMYPCKAEIDPLEIVMVVMVASGRKLITHNLFKEDPAKTLAVAGVLLVCIYGIKTLSEKKIMAEECS